MLCVQKAQDGFKICDIRALTDPMMTKDASYNLIIRETKRKNSNIVL